MTPVEVHSEHTAKMRRTKELQSEYHSDRNVREVDAVEAKNLRERLNAALASETLQYEETVRAKRWAETAAKAEAELESELQKLRSEHAQAGSKTIFSPPHYCVMKCLAVLQQ